MDKKQKNRRDIGKVATKIIAAVLAVMMVFAVVASLVFYIFA